MTSSSEAAAGELVQLYIYDLSGGMARTFSQMLLGRQVRGRMSPNVAREATPAAPAVTPCCWRHLPPHPTAPHSTPTPFAPQIEAIWHTAVVVGGMEHFFGGGINIVPAGGTPFGRPQQVLDLG